MTIGVRLAMGCAHHHAIDETVAQKAVLLAVADNLQPVLELR